MNRILVYSIATASLYCLAGPDKKRIQRATGFFLKHNEKIYLITNDHVVSGLGHGDRKILSETGAIPSWLEINLFAPTNINFDSQTPTPTGAEPYKLTVPLYNDVEQCLEPRWNSHPELGHLVDVVALDIQEAVDKALINAPATLSFSSEKAKYRPMDRVFVVGFPLDIDKSPNPFPIYKSASIASEPDFLGERPYVLIDGKTKSGMSGSPVILQHGTKMTDQANGFEFSSGETELIGVYSGRESESNSTFEAELGLMWSLNRAISPILNLL